MYSKSTPAGTATRHVLAWIAIAFALFPVLWIVSASISPANTLIGQRLIPKDPSWVHYHELFGSSELPFARWIWNSVKVSGMTALFTVFLTALAAYAFSRFRFRGRRMGLFSILIVQIFPQMLAMVAIYLLLLDLGKVVPWLGLNTYLGLMTVYLGAAMGFNTWLVKGFFDSIPRSLDESAMMDGASGFQTFWRIIVPLARPVLAAIFVLQFIATYSDFLLASIILTDAKSYTLAVGLRFFITDQYGARWGTFAAAAVLGALPIVVVFLLLQNLFVSGLTRGAVKG